MTYKDISVEQYEKISELLHTEGMDELTLQVGLISILHNMEEDYIWSKLPLDTYSEYAGEISFLMKAPEVTGKFPKEITLNGKKYKVSLDERKLTAGQYIDYQTFTQKDQDKYFANILSCFLIPEGHNYCEGYDVTEVTEDIRKYMSIEDALNMCLAIKKKSMKLMRRTLYFLKAYLAVTMKEKKKRKEVQRQMTELIDLFESGVGHTKSTLLRK